MPVQPTYPGVYIEELPSGVRTISGVSTSVTAFIGYTSRGLDHRAKRLFGFADFERHFGGLNGESELSYAVRHFFANGGGEAYVVRVPKTDAKTAKVTIEDGTAEDAKKALTLSALSKGAWGNMVLVDVDYDGIPAGDGDTFNLTVSDLTTGTVESFPRVRMTGVKAVVGDESSGSSLISVAVADAGAGRPAQTGTTGQDLALEADGTPTAVQALDEANVWAVKISSSTPAGKIAAVPVAFLEANEKKPTSVQGVCRLLERKINAALAKVLPGARVRCLPTSSGRAVRVVADFSPELLPDSLDPVLTFEAGDTHSALGALGLEGANANVAHYRLGKGTVAQAQSDPVEAGEDGTKLPESGDLIGSPGAFTGLYALDKVDLFNILCIPDATRAKAGDPTTLDDGLDPNAIFAEAMQYCQKRRAFLIVDPPPGVTDVDAAFEWKSSGLSVSGNHGAAYFPRVRMPDPLDGFKLRTFAPSGVIAGVYARTDAGRGIWKAPAGLDASLDGVQGFSYRLTDAENGALNPIGLNCLRSFAVHGNVAWGARTLEGSDARASEWKYVPVRRLALYLEESLYRGTQWVVFEPNDEPLWAQIRLNVGAFMNTLFRQGAFQGATPREAYLVKCDRETTTQNDIDRGVVNIVVGFAPLKPAEFVILKIQQLAGQIQT
jgi:uncharacterized protein